MPHQITCEIDAMIAARPTVDLIGIAAVRTVVQLSLLGLILQWVFALNRWYYVIPYLVFMLAVAARTAVSRSTRFVPGATWAAFGTLILASSITAFSVTEVIIGIEPWYAPQYLIPLIGMLLGNALTGISLGLDKILNDFVTQRNAIEGRLALGKTIWGATLPYTQQAIRTGMIPIVNSMSVVGLVSLPGMMTGQILAGVDPKDAISYQILIMFMIATCTAIGVCVLCLICYRLLADPYHRIRWERIMNTNK